jgi:hypothetical protein
VQFCVCLSPKTADQSRKTTVKHVKKFPIVLGRAPECIPQKIRERIFCVLVLGLRVAPRNHLRTFNQRSKVCIGGGDLMPTTI